MTPVPENNRFRIAHWLLAAVALGLVLFWLWIEWCRFPWSVWNDVRLVPAFMAAAGEPVYSPPGQGVIGTWMYGPVPIWLLRPATWMPDIVSASLAAGFINIVLPLAAIGLACATWPLPGATRRHRLSAFILAIAIWPEASWRFLQADNYAVVLGLLGCPFLLMARIRPWAGWVAALFAAAAVGCKQTSLGIPVAQLAWLAATQGRSAALHHGLRLAAGGALLASLTLSQFDAAGLWHNLVTLPGLLPFTEEPARRVLDLSLLLLVHVALPSVFFWWSRRQPDPAGGMRLARFLWLFSLPLGAVAMMKTGGTLNSLQSLLLALPALSLGLVLRLEKISRVDIAPLCAALAILTARLWELPRLPLRPVVTHLKEGVALARANPGQLWFPWNPLVSYFAEGRFQHAEDGFYVRLMAGRPATYTEALAHLPPHFAGIAEVAGVEGWGISESLLKGPVQEHHVGAWRIRTGATPAPEPSAP